MDLVLKERRMIETALDILEAVAVRLNTREPIPNVLLGDAVDVLDKFTSQRHDTGEEETETSGRPAQRAAARVLVDEMKWALEALERGEAGSAGAFVVHGRACIRLLREHLGLDDFRLRGLAIQPLSESEQRRWLELMPDQSWTPAGLAAFPHFQRLVGRYGRLAAASPVRSTKMRANER